MKVRIMCPRRLLSGLLALGLVCSSPRALGVERVEGPADDPPKGSWIAGRPVIHRLNDRVSSLDFSGGAGELPASGAILAIAEAASGDYVVGSNTLAVADGDHF